MTPIEFETHLDQYGSNLDHWPTSLRAQASAVINENPTVKSLLQRQEAIEKQLKLINDKAPSYLQNKIIGQIETTEPMDRLLNWLSLSFARTAIALVLPIATGMVLGGMFGSEAQLQTEVDTISYTQYLLESENEI